MKKGENIFRDGGMGFLLAAITPVVYSLIISEITIGQHIYAYLIGFLLPAVLLMGVIVFSVRWGFAQSTLEGTWLTQVHEVLVSPITLLLHMFFGLVFLILVTQGHPDTPYIWGAFTLLFGHFKGLFLYRMFNSFNRVEA